MICLSPTCQVVISLSLWHAPPDDETKILATVVQTMKLNTTRQGSPGNGTLTRRENSRKCGEIWTTFAVELRCAVELMTPWDFGIFSAIHFFAGSLEWGNVSKWNIWKGRYSHFTHIWWQVWHYFCYNFVAGLFFYLRKYLYSWFTLLNCDSRIFETIYEKACLLKITQRKKWWWLRFAGDDPWNRGRIMILRWNSRQYVCDNTSFGKRKWKLFFSSKNWLIFNQAPFLGKPKVSQH